jgi:aminoglycoside phosphotransferase (APT) family kinase protein
MRQGWERNRAELALDRAEVEKLLDPAFPAAAVLRVEPVRGGLVNTNFKITLAGRSEPLLLRLYQREGDHGQKEIALLRQLAPGVPVPALLYAARSNPVSGHSYAILSFVEGRSLDALALAGEDISSAARTLGAALAAIHAHNYAQFGFLDAALNVMHRIDLDRTGLLAYLQHSFAAGPGAERLGPELISALRFFIEREGDRIAAWPGAPCLVHGDCNPSNLIVREAAHGGFELAAILDWEFAFSGTPGFDFAHLLRPPLGRHARFAEAVAAGYREAGGALPPDWREVARITDLFAWIDIVSRPDAGASVIADARHFIAAIVDG